MWLGRLPSGVMSPGYVPSVSRDKRPGVYLVPIVEYRNRMDGGSVDDMTPDGIEKEKRWAEEHVKLIYIDNQGLSGEEITRDYLVYVVSPFWSAFTGELVRKPGRRFSLAATPDGVTGDDMARNKMIDINTSVIEKMRMARARYGTPDNPTIGVPYGGREEKFPREGDHWV